LLPLSNNKSTTENSLAMTQNTIKNQIDAIHKATAQATKSRESAMHFLTKSGIIQNLPKVNATSSVSKKK
jgi:hypothetical protein